MLTVTIFFVIAAAVTLVVGAMGKCPWWVSVACLCVVELLRVLPK